MIRRGKHTTNYTVIPNCVFESGLSAEAVGILCYLVGRPENWKINSTEVARRFACGVQRVQRVLRELEAAKYAKREQGGKGGGFNWVVYDTVQNGELEPPILAKKRESQKAIIENSVNRVLRAIESTDSLPSTDSLESTEEAKASLSPETGNDADAKIPRCPHDAIIDLYMRTLPELPRIVKSRWPGSGSEIALRARWREDTNHQSLDFWTEFFRAVRTNLHWMGDNDRGGTADLH